MDRPKLKAICSVIESLPNYVISEILSSKDLIHKAAQVVSPVRVAMQIDATIFS